MDSIGSYFFAKTYCSSIYRFKDIAPTEWRYGNASKINPMVDLAARSRRVFIIMLNQPIQVLKQTELLGHQFAVYGTAENPLFLAKEVGEVLEYSESNSSKLTNLVDDDEKVRNIVTTPGGNQEVWMLTEDGLYEVLMQSRKPIAKQFKKGVKQILHEVRTTGGYLATKSEDTPEEIMARALTIAQATLAKREERLKQLEVKAEQQQATIELQEKEIKNVTKNNRFLFGYLNIISTFAMYFNSQGKRKPAICVGIFYAITFCFIVKILIYRLLPPCGVLMHPLPCEVKYNGKGQPFFCL